MFDGFLAKFKEWWSKGDYKDKVIFVLLAVIAYQFFF